RGARVRVEVDVVVRGGDPHGDVSGHVAAVLEADLRDAADLDDAARVRARAERDGRLAAVHGPLHVVEDAVQADRVRVDRPGALDVDLVRAGGHADVELG